MNPKTVKKALKDAIQAMTDYKWLFSARRTARTPEGPGCFRSAQGADLACHPGQRIKAFHALMLFYVPGHLAGDSGCR